MKIVGGFGLALLLAVSGFAQNRSGFVHQFGISRGFSSQVFPGGTSGMPGIQRFTPSVTYPGGGGPQIGIPAPNINGAFSAVGGGFFGRPFNGNLFGTPFNGFGQSFQNGFGRGGGFGGGFGNFGGNFGGATVVTVPYGYPVYVGGGGCSDPSCGAYASGYAAPPAGATPAQAAPQQPNVIIVYPSQQGGAPVVMGPQGQGAQVAPAPGAQQQPGVYQAPEEQQPAAEEQAPSNEPAHYLIALKDHTIYSAIAYWVEGDTLHYFTSGNTHNQVSLSLVDKPLTERLNKEMGISLKLPQ